MASTLLGVSKVRPFMTFSTSRPVRAFRSPSTAAHTAPSNQRPGPQLPQPSRPAPAAHAQEVTRPAHNPPAASTPPAAVQQPQQQWQPQQQEQTQAQEQEQEQEHGQEQATAPQQQKQRLPSYIVRPHSSVKSAAHILLQHIENGQPIRVSCKPDCLLKALQILGLTRSLATRTLGLDLGFQPFTPPMAPLANAVPTFVFTPSPPAPAAPFRITTFVSPNADPAALQQNITSRLERFGHVCIPDIHTHKHVTSAAESLLLVRKEALMRAHDFWLYPELSVKTIDGRGLPSVDLLLVKCAPPRQEARAPLPWTPAPLS